MFVDYLDPYGAHHVVHGRVHVITTFRAVRPRHCFVVEAIRRVLDVLYRLLILRNLLMNYGIVAFRYVNNSGIYVLVRHAKFLPVFVVA